MCISICKAGRLQEKYDVSCPIKKQDSFQNLIWGLFKYTDTKAKEPNMEQLKH